MDCEQQHAQTVRFQNLLLRQMEVGTVGWPKADSDDKDKKAGLPSASAPKHQGLRIKHLYAYRLPVQGDFAKTKKRSGTSSQPSFQKLILAIYFFSERMNFTR